MEHETMVKHAAAYLRRSSASPDVIDPVTGAVIRKGSPGDASDKAQRDTCARLAAAFAPDAPLVEYRDWGVSGRKDDRPDYVRLKAAIAAGQVCCVLAYSLSRLGRNAGELVAFFALCRAHNVTVTTEAEGKLSAESAMGEFLLTIMAAMAQLESSLAMERSAAARAARQERGDAMTRPVYGFKRERIDGVLTVVPDPDVDRAPILDAYREARTISGTVNKLNEKGIRASRGGTWSTSQLTRVITAWAPEMLPRKTARGRRYAMPAALYAGLLKCCRCGTILTPNRARAQYYCSKGHVSKATHPRYTVQEKNIKAWAMLEAARLAIPDEAVEMRVAEAAKVEHLTARRERDNDLYGVGEIDKAEWLRRLAQTKGEIEDAEDAARIVEPLPEKIDWSLGPEVLGPVLRNLWRWIELDVDMKPVRAEWHRVDLRRP